MYRTSSIARILSNNDVARVQETFCYKKQHKPLVAHASIARLEWEFILPIF